MVALASAFVLSLTFVPAMIAIVVKGRVSETEVKPIRWFKERYAPVLGRAVARPMPFILGGVGVFVAAVLAISMRALRSHRDTRKTLSVTSLVADYRSIFDRSLSWVVLGVLVFVPRPTRRENHIARQHWARFALNNCGGAFPLQHKSQRIHGVTMRPGLFSGHQHLKVDR